VFNFSGDVGLGLFEDGTRQAERVTDAHRLINVDGIFHFLLKEGAHMTLVILEEWVGVEEIISIAVAVVL
jgi:hypothetical protein